MTVCPSLPGTKGGWGVPGTQDFGLKPGSSQANLDELGTLLSAERPGQVEGRAGTLLLAGAWMAGSWSPSGSAELHNRMKVDVIHHCLKWKNIHTPKYTLQVAPLDGIAQPN